MNTTQFETLKHAVAGDIILPGDKDYAEASKTLLASGAPTIIVRPRTAQDVAAAVLFAKEQALVLSVRGGGHSNAGFGTNNGGLVIDLIAMHDITITDPSNSIVRIGGGATWGAAATELQKHGLAISSGDTKSVGVGGLTLAGGVGWMVRKYGLSLDSLVAAEVVTADGSILHASNEDHADLFWAIRGGGGNFGVVTCFEFKAHSTGKVYAGSIIYDYAALPDILKGWRNYMRHAPEELTTTALVMPDFGGRPPAIMVIVCYAGDDKVAAMQALDPLLQLGKVIHSDIQEKQYADMLEEVHPPKGARIVVNNVFMQHFTDEVIDLIAKQGGQVLQIRSIGGAMNRVEADATAFAHRNSEVLIVNPNFFPPTATDEAIKTGLQPWRAIEAHGKGAYVNFFSEVGEYEVSASYPKATYDRLAEIKQNYDPDNLFSQNFNIAPKQS